MACFDANAQVVSDGNFVINGGGGTVTNFTVPAGNDRVIIVGIHSGGATPTSVTYNGMALTQAIASGVAAEADIWYLALGSGAAIGPDNVVANGSPFRTSAHSLNGVDQAAVFANAMTANGTATSSTLAINTSNTNNLVLDIFVITAGTVTGAAAPHTSLGISTAAAGGSSPATGAAVNVGWNFPNNNFAHSGIELLFAPSNQAPDPNIPTLSQWGLIILGLLFVVLGIVAIGQERYGKYEIKVH